MTDADKPKIFVDDDWKRQAREEKHKLAEQEKKEETKAGPAGERRRGRAGGPGELPPADFEVLVSTFATQALLYMGAVEHPSMGRVVNLDAAKFNIDLLTVLEEKTKGNLSAQEKEALDQTLHQLRMMYVEVASMNAGPIGAP